MGARGRQEGWIPNLRRLRTAQGLTPEQLVAQLPSLDLRTLDYWETGESPIPQGYWQPLADLFGVSVSHLLAWQNGPSNGGVREAA